MMDTIHAGACTCSKLDPERNYYKDCTELADDPPYSCVYRVARHGEVKTGPCECTTGETWHLNGTCLRCNQWVRDTLVLVDRLPFYLKAMGMRCYDKGGITFPLLDYGRVLHRFVDERVPGMPSRTMFTEVNGRFRVDRMLTLMGAVDIEWHCPWPNMPEMAFFRRLVNRAGDDVDEVCDEARGALYDLGLIIRPTKDWVPD